MGPSRVAIVVFIVVAVAVFVTWAFAARARHRMRERFYASYAEDVNALPSGLSVYLSAYSDASTATPGKWADVSGRGNHFAFDRGAAAPLSTDPGARGFDLAGCALVGPQCVALLPIAGQDFTLAWVARDPQAASPSGQQQSQQQSPPATLFKLRANTATNNGVQVTMFAPDDGEGGDGKQQLAAAVGSGSAGTWRFPPSPDFAAYALVRRGPELALYRNGARMEAASEAGPADDGMLFSNPPAVVNPDGAWTGRLGAVALWGRALQDLEVAAAAAHFKAEAGDLPRVRAEADATVSAAAEGSALARSLEADAQARTAVDDAGARAANPTAGGARHVALRERFADLPEKQIDEAASDAEALVNGGAVLRRV